MVLSLIYNIYSGSGTASSYLQERKKHHPSIHSRGFLSIRSVPPCFRWGWRQTFYRSFPPLVRLSLSLNDTGPFAPGVDLMAFQIDLVPYHQDL